MAGRLSIILSGVPGRMAQKIAAVCEDERAQAGADHARIVHALARLAATCTGPSRQGRASRRSGAQTRAVGCLDLLRQPAASAAPREGRG